MRAVLGVVSLLVALAIVGVVATKRLNAVKGSVGVSLPAASSSAEGAAILNVRQQSQQLQQRVNDDVAKAMEQAASRRDEADK